MAMGLLFAAEIKSKQAIPVIFLTASDDEASVVTGLDMGADDYVIKPFRPRELLARIRNALRKSGHGQTTFEVSGLCVEYRRWSGTQERQRSFSVGFRIPSSAGICEQS